MNRRTRRFTKQEPSKDAKTIYIFCDGEKREYNYFTFFKAIDSRINVIIHKPQIREDKSPRGLLNTAKLFILKTPENPDPKFEFLEGDEVWFVCDIDRDKDNSRASQFELIHNECNSHKGWDYALSNPCFEVWLYYHLHNEKPEFEGMAVSENWKQFVPDKIPGGFDHRKHTLEIKTAIINAELNFIKNGIEPELACTEVFRLGTSIVNIIGDRFPN